MRCGASASGRCPTETSLVLVPGDAAWARVTALLARHGLERRRYVVVHPGSRWLFKCWPAAATAAVIDRLAADGWPVVLTGAPDPAERALVAAVRAATRAPVVDLAGQLSLPELAALIGAARLFFGVDSAPMHMAAAMGTPTVALFGPSGDAEWGAVARRPPGRRLDRASLPPLRQQRLRRQQPLRLPADAARSPRRRRHRGPARRDRKHVAAMKLGIVRQRYTPFGGAERFVARAMEALAARGVGLRVYTRRWPASAAATAIEPVHLRPVLHRQPLARRELRPRGQGRRSRGIAPTSSRPTSASTAATSSAPATASTASGWRSGCAPGARSSASRIAANGYHRYILDAEARVFADPELKAVICISQMVKDDVRAHFPIAERQAARHLQRRRPGGVRPAGARRPRGDAAAAVGFVGEHVVFLLVGSGYARKGVPAAIRALARLPAAARLVVVGRDKRQDRYPALAARLGRRGPRALRGTAGRPAALVRRGRRVRAADALRPLVECGARGAGLRPAGGHQHPLRRRRAGARVRRRDCLSPPPTSTPSPPACAS